MIEPTTLARPYARAAFDYAQETGLLAQWADNLHTLAQVSQDPTVSMVLRDPALTGDQRAQVLESVVGDHAQGVSAFLHVMADNGRLALLPDVAQLFDELKAQYESTVTVDVTSAFEVSAEEQAQLAAAMTERLKRTVHLNTHTDPTLLGGAVIRAGDLVIDGSVRGRLEKLTSALAN
jgi:F-type H+-transporting ATPase subunit delta